MGHGGELVESSRRRGLWRRRPDDQTCSGNAMARRADGGFVDYLPTLSSVFNGSQQTITSQPGPLRYVILPTCSWSSSSSLTRSSTLHYFSPCSFLLSIAYDHNKKAFFSGLTVAFLSTQSLVLLSIYVTRKFCLNAFISNDFILSSSVLFSIQLSHP